MILSQLYYTEIMYLFYPLYYKFLKKKSCFTYIYYTLMFTKTKQMQKELPVILALDSPSYTSKDS